MFSNETAEDLLNELVHFEARYCHLTSCTNTQTEILSNILWSITKESKIGSTKNC